MTGRTGAEIEAIRRMLLRAESRFAAGWKVSEAVDPLPGELDNNFEGVVHGIHHVVEAHVLGATGARRKADDDSAAVLVDAVVIELRRSGIPDVPSAQRIKLLNARRNTSAHEGSWLDAIDGEMLGAAVSTARELLTAVRLDLRRRGLDV